MTPARHTLTLKFALALLLSAAAAAAATSTWVYPGPCHLQYKLDAQGNRVMDYSDAGYGGGGVALPAPAVVVTVTPVAGDNTSNIQAAINTASALPLNAQGFRGAVLLKPGNYGLNGTLHINSSGVVLRGSGSGAGGSLLNMTGSYHLAISVAGSGSWATTGSSATFTDSYVPSGSKSFHVNSTTGFSVGNTILIRRPVTDAWVHFMRMDVLVRNGAPQTWIAAGTNINTDRVIQAINGNQITLDVPLTDSFDATYTTGSMQRYTFTGRITKSAVEHLQITAPALDVVDLTTQFQALNFSALYDGWAQDLVINDTENSNTLSSTTKRITFDHVTVRHSIAYTASAGPEDFVMNGTQILISNCSSTGNAGVWAFSTMGEVTGPIVLLYCSADKRGFEPHMRWATGLLADTCSFPGNDGTGGGQASIAFSDRGYFGSGHGWDSGWALAWNTDGYNLQVQGPPGVDNWCIGCTGNIFLPAEPGSTYVPPSGIFESLGTHVSLGSFGPTLYEAQLADRLGLACGSPTATPSSTPSRSATPSSTPSSSPTRSSTPSSTPSRTNSPSPTRSESPSHTPTSSATATLSPSPPGPSSTITASFSPTRSSTASYSPTPTATSSLTPSPSRTATSSLSPTLTLSPVTATLSPTPSLSSTTTPTRTLTPVASPTRTLTFTATPTTVPNSCSGVPAWSGNNVHYSVNQQVLYNGRRYSCLQAHDSQPTWDPVSAPALWKDLGACSTTTSSLNVTSALAYPNPSSGGEITLNFELSSATADKLAPGYAVLDPSAKLELRIFSVAGQLLWTQPLDGAFLSSGRHAFKWNGRDANGMAMPNGTYFYCVRIQDNGGISQKSMALILLR